MKGSIWVGIIALSLLVGLACSLPGPRPPEGIQTAIARFGDELDEELVNDFIILTPPPTPTPTWTPTITPTRTVTLTGVGAGGTPAFLPGGPSPTPRLTSTPTVGVPLLPSPTSTPFAPPPPTPAAPEEELPPVDVPPPTQPPAPTAPPPTAPPPPTNTPPADPGDPGEPTPTPIPPVLIVNSADDADDGLCDPIHCSFREALNVSNLIAGQFSVSIQFNIPGTGPHPINLSGPLPMVTGPVEILGSSQPGADCSTWPPTLQIELDGSGAGANVSGLHLTGGDITVEGLVINRFDGSGLLLDANGNNLIECNFIGTGVSGTIGFGNQVGVTIENGSTNNIIGGSANGGRNLISGNVGPGVRIAGGATGNSVQGNYIGADVSGILDLGNGDLTNMPGVLISGAMNNRIGGVVGNLLSGNGSSGVHITGAGSGNLVQGNFIGTTLDGEIKVGNGQHGVFIDGGSSNNLVGGTLASERNLISGNVIHGVRIEGLTTTGNAVQGNRIGTDFDGDVDLGNGDTTNSAGVAIVDAPNNLIGGAVAGAGNLIAGNGSFGIRILGGDATNNQVQGNAIGTDFSGTAKIGNARHGVYVDGGASGNTIGGPSPEARNLISGNNEHGVMLEGNGGVGNIVQGNYIGTNVTGTDSLSNTMAGIQINDANNLIGGPTPGAGNLISGNGAAGIWLFASGALGNQISGNFIGTNASGTIPVGNSGPGVYIQGGVNNFIGGTITATRNLISGNGASGLALEDASALGNQVQGNYIGTDVTGTQNLGNSASGILQQNGATNNTIGGSTPEAGNLIIYNRASGIRNNSGALTLTYSVVSTNTAGQGGGIYNAGNLTVMTTTLSGNIAISTGGGIYNDAGALAALTDVNVLTNQAVDGGGIGNVSTNTLTLQNGQVNLNTATVSGGGIYNRTGAGLILTNTLLSNNSAGFTGGGIYNWAGAILTVTNSSLVNNIAIQGGAAHNDNTSKLTLADSAISQNQANLGGGIMNTDGDLSLVSSRVSTNTAQGDGGGLWHQSPITLTLINSSVSANVAGQDGGGMFIAGSSPAQIVNATISGNQAITNGGGISNTGVMTMTFVTVASNTAAFGGGIQSSGGLTLANTIVANSLSGGNCSGAGFSSRGYNLASDTTCDAVFTDPNDLTNVNPLLDLLQLINGTFIHPLLSGGPAIDRIPAGINGCGTAIITDQRGATRPQPSPGSCDSGAYEAP